MFHVFARNWTYEGPDVWKSRLGFLRLNRGRPSGFGGGPARVFIDFQLLTWFGTLERRVERAG
eukprot:gene15016-7263_t